LVRIHLDLKLELKLSRVLQLGCRVGHTRSGAEKFTGVDGETTMPQHMVDGCECEEGVRMTHKQQEFREV
jgi:hypothetical protein